MSLALDRFLPATARTFLALRRLFHSSKPALLWSALQVLTPCRWGLAASTPDLVFETVIGQLQGAVAEGQVSGFSGEYPIPCPRTWPGNKGSEASFRCLRSRRSPSSQGLEQWPEFQPSSSGLGRRVESATMPQPAWGPQAPRAKASRLRIRMLLSKLPIGPQPRKGAAVGAAGNGLDFAQALAGPQFSGRQLIGPPASRPASRSTKGRRGAELALHTEVRWCTWR